MYDLINVFDVFLPQLLLYPNPSDPLNGEAASLSINNPEKYKSKVKEYVTKFAMKDEDKVIEPVEEKKEEAKDYSEPSELSDSDVQDPVLN